MTRARVLVVDDEPAMLRSVERILGREHDVRGFVKPDEALEAAAEFTPQLAIIDIRMPVMDGFALMRALKQLDPDVRVILMTGSIFDVDAQLTRAIREDAFYFIHKPFDREVLRTLIERCLELRDLEEINRRHVRHLEGQLAEARAFQQAMLPPRRACIEGIEIDALYQPSVELAGDLYDYACAGPGRVTLLVADVAGHGASAAMLTGVVRSAFRATETEEFDPAAVVRRVAEGISSFPYNRFVTLLCVRLSPAAERIEYVNAGHTGGMVLVPGAEPIDLPITGPLVSPALDGLEWKREVQSWTPGASLFMFTDGVPETWDVEERMFGLEHLREIAQRNAPAGADLLRTITTELDRFAAGRPHTDDRTLLTAHPK